MFTQHLSKLRKGEKATPVDENLSGKETVYVRQWVQRHAASGACPFESNIKNKKISHT